MLTSDGRDELLVPYDSKFINVWVRGVGSGETADYFRCAIDIHTARLRPDEFEEASAVSLSGGAVAELPKHVRDAIQTVERRLSVARLGSPSNRCGARPMSDELLGGVFGIIRDQVGHA